MKRSVRALYAAALLGVSAWPGAAGAAPTPTPASTPTIIERNGAWLSIKSYGPDVVHVVISNERAEVLKDAGYGILPRPSGAPVANHRSGAQGDDYDLNDVHLHVSAAPPAHEPSNIEKYFAPSLTPISIAVTDGGGRRLTEMTRWALAPNVVNGERTYQASAAFSSGPDEHFYGLGQNQEGHLDLRGRTLDCRHAYDAPQGETVCVPFLVSSKGYAIVWDNPSATQVSPGVNGLTLLKSDVGDRVSFFIITGDKPSAIYAAYARLTGFAPLPPKAAFGLIQSKARYASQAEVEEVAAEYRRKDYPLDVLVVDWFYWTRIGQLDIDPAQFPDPQGMNARLHAAGLKTMISFFPRFERTSRYFDELDRKGFLLKDALGHSVDGYPFRNDRMGGLIDETNPQARRWYWEHIRDNVLAKGFDYPWLDATEPNLTPDDYFFSIGSGARYHNVFPLLHVGGVADELRNWRPEARVLILARAAYLGSQRTGALFWSSDIAATWEALERQVPTGLNMTASGIPYWGNDIGGWLPIPQKSTATKPLLLDPAGAQDTVGTNSDYPELFTRWFEYGVFQPTLRVHGLRKHNELWSFGPAAEKILADYDRLRYRLIPYIYSQGYDSYKTGMPFMRPLWMDFGADPEVSDLGSEYMFGPAFLVAPVTEQGQTIKRVYLPRGADWYDYWTKQRFSGGSWITVSTPIEHIPLFVRAGSIVPIGSDIRSTAQKQSVAQLQVYPGADADFTLYDDDGHTYGYQTKEGVKITRLRWNDEKGVLGTEGDDKLLQSRVVVVRPSP